MIRNLLSSQCAFIDIIKLPKARRESVKRREIERRTWRNRREGRTLRQLVIN